MGGSLMLSRMNAVVQAKAEFDAQQTFPKGSLAPSTNGCPERARGPWE
jgi:hypothetical protein